jgi:hypothetical protein
MEAHAESDDDFAFWNYKDLIERRIIGGRRDLHHKQTALGFPKAVKLSGSARNATALFQRAAVQAWIRSRLSQP